MCVILFANGTRPTPDMVARAWEQNSHGGGLAWREKKEVVWLKGLNLQEMQDHCKTLPMPYVAHFRIASIGGIKAGLTHPFPVTSDVKLDLKGRTKGAVLFHNGHWGDWHKAVLEAALRTGTKVPTGAWSDTRAMAFLTSIYGPGFMDLLLDQRGVLLTPEKVEIFTGGGWEFINDVWCSNDYFMKRTTTSHGGKVVRSYGGRLCSMNVCTKTAKAGSSYCEEHDRKNPTQPGVSAVSPGTTQAGATTSKGESGGAPETSPFRHQVTEPLTLREVQKLWSEKKISKNKWKKFQNQFKNLLDANPKHKLRAERELLALTEQVMENLPGHKV